MAVPRMPVRRPSRQAATGRLRFQMCANEGGEDVNGWISSPSRSGLASHAGAGCPQVL
jgi:hypothetical protein